VCSSDNESQSAATAVTTASLLTGVGRSAIAVIAIAGPQASQVVDRCFVPATNRDFATGQIRYGNWCGRDDSHGEKRRKDAVVASAESVVVVPIGDQEFEVHCHGGAAAIERILDDLRGANVHVVDWQDPQWRPTEPTLIRESIDVLSQCVTTRTAAIAMDQVRGAMQNWCQQSLNADSSIDSMRQRASDLLGFAAIGSRLTDRFRVVLAGPPNVGKSSLINAMVGFDRSITLDQPGTTRDVLHADTVIDGVAVQLSDTAGIRVGGGEIETEGIRRANQAVSEADLVVWVSTPNQPVSPAASSNDVSRSIHVLNKADLQASTSASTISLRTVATTGQGIPELLAAILRSLVPLFPPPGSAVPITPRQIDCLQQMIAASDRDEQQRAVRLLIG